MTTTLACPDETELLMLAMGEPVPARLSAHAEGCSACQARLDRLRSEVASLRHSHDRGTTPSSTERDPAVEHGAEARDAGTTKEWTPADPAGPTDTDSAGPEAVAAARAVAEGLDSVPDAIGKYKVVGRIDGGGEADVYRVC
jgi:hypothetical protein